MRSVAEMIPLDQAKCVTHVVPDVLADPAMALFSVVADRINQQRISIPLPNGISKIAREHALGMVPIEPDRSPFAMVLKHLINPVRKRDK